LPNCHVNSGILTSKKTYKKTHNSTPLVVPFNADMALIEI